VTERELCLAPRFAYSSTVKDFLLEAVPFGVVTSITPLVAPAGTTASMSVLCIVNLAGTPLKLTAVAFSTL